MTGKDQRGFVATLLLILMPFLVAALACIFAGYLLLKNDGEARHICRVEVLAAQEQILKDLQGLLALNPAAKILRMRRSAAEAKLKALASTPAAAAASAELAIIIAEQLRLASQQKILLLRGKARSRLAPSLAMQKLRLRLHRSQSIQSESVVPSSVQGLGYGATFDVAASPSDSLTPDYRPSEQFTSKQEMRVNWSINFMSFLPRWLSDLLSLQKLRLSGECSATIEKENGKWLSKITMAKLSLR